MQQCCAARLGLRLEIILKYINTLKEGDRGTETYLCKKKSQGISKTGKAFENGMNYASTLIHEFNHSFVNPLYKAHAEQLTPIGEKLLKLSYRAMNSQAYKNDITIVNESIVRAAVIIYMQENGFTAEQVKAEMYDQIGCSFHWMPELVSTMRNYAKHRKRYKTLGDYYPEIAKCLSKYLKEETERIEHPL